VKTPFAVSLLALFIGIVGPADSSGLGLSEPAEGEALGAGETVEERPAAESPEHEPSLSTLAQQVEELRASRNQTTIAVLVAGLTAMAAGVGLFLVAVNELEDSAFGNQGDLKIARGTRVVCFGLGLFGLIAAAGP